MSAKPDAPPESPPIGFRAAWRSWGSRLYAFFVRWGETGRVCRSCGFRPRRTEGSGLGPPYCPRCGHAYDD